MTSSWAIVLRQPSNHDELFMQQSLRFSETLRELKNLRKQLYSAAEYFEASYGKDDEKEMVIETLKDYAIKATVNTVDHLGSVADKFNGFLDEKINDMSGTELRLSCMEQRMSSCREYVSNGGINQQLLFMETPKHHKRYILADDDSSRRSMSEYRCRSFNSEEDTDGFRNAIRARIRDIPTRRCDSGKQLQRFRSMPGTFSFMSDPHDRTADVNRTKISASLAPEKRTVSPIRFPLLRSGSLLVRSISLSNPKKQQNQAPGARRPDVAAEKGGRDMEQYTSKSKRMFKSLLGMQRGKDGGVSFRLFDENRK